MEKLLTIGTMLLVGILFGVIGFTILIRERNLRKHGIKTTAVVVDRTLRGRATVEYQTAQGLQRARSLFSGLGSYFRIGSLVIIFYDKENPQRFSIKEDKNAIFLGSIFSLVGIVFIGVSAVIYFSF